MLRQFTGSRTDSVEDEGSASNNSVELATTVYKVVQPIKMK